MQDVARLAGVSPKTVSNVINAYPFIRDDTRARVEAAIAELDYQPNLSARSLRSGRSGMIALAVPELSLAYFAQLADEVIRAAAAKRLVVLIEQTGGEREAELEVLRSPRLQLTDGLLFSPLALGDDDAALINPRLPLVLLGERMTGTTADHVAMRNVDAARAATDHLISLGRRRIAVIGAHHGEAALRIDGYRAALDAAGIPFDEALVDYEGEWHRADGAAAMSKLLASGVRFDALFALNDELALGAMWVLQQQNIEIPREVAIIGFDDVEDGRYSTPSLSTVDPGKRQIARAAVEALHARIMAPEPDSAPARVIRSEFTVIPRGSSAR
jgi:DNA-binding LacI/PurR family transcriptional regulator